MIFLFTLPLALVVHVTSSVSFALTIISKPVGFSRKREYLLLEEFKSLGVKAIFYSGEGEPLMNKSLPEIIEKQGYVVLIVH